MDVLLAFDLIWTCGVQFVVQLVQRAVQLVGQRVVQQMHNKSEQVEFGTFWAIGCSYMCDEIKYNKTAGDGRCRLRLRSLHTLHNRVIWTVFETVSLNYCSEGWSC